MKRILGIIFLCSVFVISSFNTNIEVIESESTDYGLNDRVVPILKHYEVSDENKKIELTDNSRVILENTEEVKNNKRLQEVIRLAIGEMIEIQLIEHDIEKLFMDQKDVKGSDIYIQLSDLTSVSESEETYTIDIDENGIIIKAASENAVLHALRTLTHLSITENGIPFGSIQDYPDVAERRVHIDMGRKYFTKDWIIQQIKEMSYFKMNAIQMHFSENMGYRIESDFAPEIMSEEYLTKQEVKEILEVARLYGVSVIPSFDTPGHTEHILKAHPEFGQININGERSKVALDVTNEDAIAFVYGLLDEILELFDTSEHIHLGADEYMEFDRPPFTTEYMPVLNTYAKETLGEAYNWKDVMATYINNLAEHVYERGFKPRIWNDGIYYGEKGGWCSGGEPQKVEMHKYIGIDFWSQMAWNPCIARLNTFIEKGHTDIYNINASFFYYVLRPTKPEDGREQHSFDYLNQDIRIFEEWTPGKFQENTIDDNHPSIKGASLAIWNDVPDLVGEDVISEDISKELRSLATKSWNINSNKQSTIERFRETYSLIGNVPTFKKGEVVTETSHFKEAIDTSELESILLKVKNIDLDKYDEESASLLNNYILEAENKLNDLTNVTQDEIDTLIDLIVTAIKDLKEKEPIPNVDDKPVVETPSDGDKPITNKPSGEDKQKPSKPEEVLPSTGMPDTFQNISIILSGLGVVVLSYSKLKKD